MELIAQVKALQRRHEGAKVQWAEHCAKYMGGTRDPAKHHTDSLRRFLHSRMTSPSCTYNSNGSNITGTSTDSPGHHTRGPTPTNHDNGTNVNDTIVTDSKNTTERLTRRRGGSRPSARITTPTPSPLVPARQATAPALQHLILARQIRELETICWLPQHEKSRKLADLKARLRALEQ